MTYRRGSLDVKMDSTVHLHPRPRMMHDRVKCSVDKAQDVSVIDFQVMSPVAGLRLPVGG